jgi:cystathionine beta-lyase family protein involved in aluminum resistance
MKIKFFATSLLILILTSFQRPNHDVIDLLTRKWLLNTIMIEGKSYDAEVLGSRARGVQNILDFTISGKCYILTPEGKKLQTNQWELMNSNTMLKIKSEDGSEQNFNIAVLSKKKLILTMMDREVENVFVYTAVEEKKR